MKRPIVSVIIPAFNEEKLIGKCIDELQKQTIPRDSFEVIVCNNNSTDATESIARSKGVRVVKEDHNQGYVYAKNTGASYANGEYIAFLDADSTADKHWLENAITLLSDEKVICVGGTSMPNPSTAITKMMFGFFDLFARLNQLWGISLIWTSGLVIKKAAFHAMNGFNSHMKTSDDWDLVVRLQKKYGRRATRYSPKIKTYTIPRKQNNIKVFIPYMFSGLFGYIFVHLLRVSKSFGSNQNIR